MRKRARGLTWRFIVLAVIATSLVVPGAARGDTTVEVRGPPYDTGSVCFIERGNVHIVEPNFPGEPDPFTGCFQCKGCYRGTGGVTAPMRKGILAVEAWSVALEPPFPCVPAPDNPHTDGRVCYWAAGIYWASSNVAYISPVGGTLTVTADFAGDTQHHGACLRIKGPFAGPATALCTSFSYLETVGISKEIAAGVTYDVRAYISLDPTGPGQILVRNMRFSLTH